MDGKMRACELAKRFPSNDPFELCEYLKIKIMRWPLEDMRGYFYQNEKGRVIVLNDSLSAKEERFVCAHEIGHYILHGGFNRVFLYTRTFLSTAKYENEADEFAAHLLYPYICIDEYEGWTVEQIASFWGMPEEATKKRLGFQC